MESVVKHVPNTYYLELRQDYITLCQSFTYRKEKSRSSPHCKALILSIMEKWTNEKIGKKKDLHVFMTHPQWVEEMYGLFARNVIIDSLDELIYEELIARESYKSARGGRNQYKYKLNYELLNKRLNPTLKNQPCEEEQDGKINDQGVKFNVATVNNQSCSSSPTLNIQPFIKSVTNNQSIESQKESAPARIAQLTSQEKQTYNNYCLCFKKDMPNTPLPNVTEKFVKDIVALASFVTTQEDMQSLFDYAKVRIYGNNPRVYPANLLNWRDAWKQEHAPLPWSPDTSKPEVIEAHQPVNRENEPLPVYLCKWVVRTGEEFNEDGHGWISKLEWYYQHTTCPEDDFYTLLLQAYQEVLDYQEGQRMKELLIEFDQLLSLETLVLS